MSATPTFAHRQRGVFLIEALVAILIFSLGVLAMIGTGTVSVAAESDAKYRTEAARLAADITQEIYVNVDISSPTTLAAALSAFELQTTGAPTSCVFTGSTPTAEPAKTVVERWQAKVAATLPGSPATMHQITRVAASGINEMRVVICWQGPNDTAARRLEFTAFIN